MSAVLGLFAVVGLIFVVFGGVWMLFRAFSESVLWGL